MKRVTVRSGASLVFKVAVVFVATMLAACGSGPVRRVSEPAASIQQLTVRANGSWSVELRINNFSSVPMRFDNIALALAVGGQAAGTLQGQPGISIGPESADVITLALSPTSGARIVVADALAARRTLAYTLKGKVDGAPENGGLRSYAVERTSGLNPVPGLSGVLR